jgi:hypothetical protein
MIWKILNKQDTILYEHFHEVRDDVIQEFLTETSFVSSTASCLLFPYGQVGQ